MNKRNVTAWMMPLAFVFTGYTVVSPIARAAEAADSEHVSALLSEAKTMAYQLKEDAQTMESFNRMTVSMETHKVTVNQIREHINALGRQQAKLREAKAEASPWQGTAIDRITPYLDELSGYTAAAIEHLTERQHNPAQYQDFLEANADYASDLSAMISDFVDYGKTRQRVERIQEKLEISPKDER
jgi:cytochrome c-type biogenesis protein CcmH/NrfF